MAAIVPSTRGFGLGWNLVREATAQANTGQVDWIRTPTEANFAIVTFALTAASGTTPVTDLTIKGADPLVLDDTYSYHVGGTTLTAQSTTATSGLLQVVVIGPRAAAAATDDVILGATGVNHAVINSVLPALMGLGLVFDRTSANELYTYKLGVTFRA